MSTKTPETEHPCQATPNATLREQVMDCRIPKNEREWWASREIESLELRNSELTARIAELERARDDWEFRYKLRDATIDLFKEMTEKAGKMVGLDMKKADPVDWMDAIYKVVTDRDSLESALAESRKDGQRLDWLEKNHVEFAEELHRIGWASPTDAQWEKLKFFLRRIRCAIDAAMLPATPLPEKP